MEVKIIGFIGDGSARYSSHVASMRKRNNIVYDLCNTSEEQVVQDMLKCDYIYVVGDYEAFSEDTWNCISLANVCGKDIRNLDPLPVKEVNENTVRFLRDLADALENANIIAKAIGVFD